ncbi:MAG: DegT/DnrJ/EryC1/StrS family aminotransferase [archaeon]
MKPAILGGTSAFSEKILVAKPSIPEFEEVHPLFKEIFESKWLTNHGKFVQELEKRIAGYIGAEHCALVSNGTKALELLIKSLDLNGEVISTPFTFSATIHAIQANNLKPVFCDINPETYNLDESKLEKLITDKTTAILAVNIFGNPVEIKKLTDIAESNNLKLLFDSAHAFGSTYLDKKIGSFGEGEAFSFHATKVFTTGEGGAVTTNNKELSEKISLMRNFGIAGEEEVVSWGTNAKMNEFSAALGLKALEQIEKDIEKLGRLNQIYKTNLEKIPGLKFQKINPDGKINYKYFTVEVLEKEFGLNRNQLHTALKSDNIFARKYFYPPCNRFPSYRSLESALPEKLPNTESVSAGILSLPMYADLKEEEIKKICEVIESIHLNAEKIKKTVQGFLK